MMHRRILCSLIGVAMGLCATSPCAQFVFEPKSSNLVFVYCFDDRYRIVPYCDVVLRNFSYYTWIHSHFFLPRPPVSQLAPRTGNTGILGLPVFVRTTKVGQDEGIDACASRCTRARVRVAYGDLRWLGSGSNHYGTASTLRGIRGVAAQYRSEFPDYDVIGINDIALPYGGIFDLNRDWSAPHHNHSRGKAVDVRGNGRPNSVRRSAEVQRRFREICLLNGARRVLHEDRGSNNEHFHVEWP